MGSRDDGESTSCSGTRQRDKEQAERDEYADAAKTGDTQASGKPSNEQRVQRKALLINVK